LAIFTADADVVPAVVFGYDRKQLVSVGHSEVPTPGFFAHDRTNDSTG